MKLTNPYEGATGAWYKGNLHCHSTNSDGRLPPEEVAALYAARGYDYLAITDHDTTTPPPPTPNLVGISGVEVTAGGPHILSIGSGKVYDTARPRPEVVAEIVADGNLCILNHPNWQNHFNHFPQEELASCCGAHGLEIYNTVIEFLQGEPYARDRWDRLLADGHRLWGYANDDLHGHDRHGGLSQGIRAMNVVRVAEPTPAAIVDALKAGRFYASTGVAIEAIELDGETLAIESPDAAEIRFVSSSGVVRKLVEDTAASYTFTGDERYVRVECWGRGYRGAFTQPIFVEQE